MRTKPNRREVLTGAASVAASAALPVLPTAAAPESELLKAIDGVWLHRSLTPEALLESLNRIANLPASERDQLRRDREAYRKGVRSSSSVGKRSAMREPA